MNIKELDFKDLTEKWTGKATKRYMYTNKELDEGGKGIDYNQFIMLRFNSVNDKHIANKYEIGGWYLLWNLMVQAKSNQCMFLEATINTIFEKINKKLTTDNIKNYLVKFNKEGIIKLNRSKAININTPLQIFISYNNNDYYPFQQGKWTGYRALPVGFVETVLGKTSPEEWAVFTVLCVRYRYWQTKVSQDKIGNVYYNFYKEHYAFPTMDQIGEIIGKGKSITSKYIEQLANNELKIIKVYESNKTEMQPIYKNGEFTGNKRKNYIYYIPLFERVEYIYQHIIKTDTRDKKIRNKNAEKFTEIATSHNFYTLTDADYLTAHFKITLLEYKKALEKNNGEAYKKMEKECSHQNGLTNIPINSQENAKVVEVDFGQNAM